MRAVVLGPDGCYPNYTTAEGCNALNFLSTGAGNSGFGWYSLYLDTTGSFNTGVGGGALALNNADSNTAVGAAALLLNTNGTQNVAVGTDALVFNDSGGFNTAVGAFALFNNTAGGANTANGFQALYSNTTGSENTANGSQALYYNTTGGENTAIGTNALNDNTTGTDNTAIGNLAGAFVTGSHDVCIGSFITGAAGVDNTTWIANVYASVAGDRPVYVNADNKIGTLVSSRRYKHEIRPMAKSSEAILSLKPVSFRYKKEFDPTQPLHFGLIAEEVAEIDPDLVTPDRDGKPETVRYEAVNAMLLNEFLKEHKTVQELKTTVAQQKQQIEALIAGLQKVSAQLELTKPAPQTVLNQPVSR